MGDVHNNESGDLPAVESCKDEELKDQICSTEITPSHYDNPNEKDSSSGDVATSGDEDDGDGSSSSDESFEELEAPTDDNQMSETSSAYEGIKIILVSNSLHGAKDHFQSFRMYSAPMANGYCFVHLVDAILNQEPNKILKTKEVVKESEKLYKQVKKSSHTTPYTRLYASVCQADGFLFRASSLLIKFDLSVALQVGWYIRKAAKLYVSNEANLQKMKHSLSADEYSSLQTAISFGVGFTNLALSILPPTYASVMNVMGFQSDRMKGLKNLDVCRRGDDFHSPLASLLLLWYYLLAKPLMCANEEYLEDGFEIAERVLSETISSYEKQCWVFHFFKAKLQILRGNVDCGLELYTETRDLCGGDFEKVKVIVLFEIGWCWVIKNDYVKALTYFSLIKDCSYWSEGLYPYVTALCLCITGDTKQGINLFKKNTLVKKRQPNNTEHYVLSRSKVAYNIDSKFVNSAQYKLLFLEMLYLWNHLTLLTPQVRSESIAFLEKLELFDKNLKPSSMLICGALKTLGGQYESAADTLELLKTYLLTQSHKTRFNLERCYGLLELALARYKIKLADSNARSEADFDAINEILDKSIQLKGYQFENRLKLRAYTLRDDIVNLLEGSAFDSQSRSPKVPEN